MIIYLKVIWTFQETLVQLNHIFPIVSSFFCWAVLRIIHWWTITFKWILIKLKIHFEPKESFYIKHLFTSDKNWSKKIHLKCAYVLNGNILGNTIQNEWKISIMCALQGYLFMLPTINHDSFCSPIIDVNLSASNYQNVES